MFSAFIVRTVGESDELMLVWLVMLVVELVVWWFALIGDVDGLLVGVISFVDGCVVTDPSVWVNGLAVHLCLHCLGWRLLGGFEVVCW